MIQRQKNIAVKLKKSKIIKDRLLVYLYFCKKVKAITHTMGASFCVKNNIEMIMLFIIVIGYETK